MSTETPEPGTPGTETDAAETGARSRRNGYLPVLPDGWQYSVTMLGPGGRVSIHPDDESDWEVTVHPQGGKPRPLPAESLADAIRQGADAVKALTRLAKVEEEYQAARKAAMAAFGDDTTADPA